MFLRTTSGGFYGRDFHALRLPKSVADEAKLVEGTIVDIEVDDGKIKVTPARPKYSLDDLLKGESAAKKKSGSREVDWGAPKGREVW